MNMNKKRLSLGLLLVCLVGGITTLPVIADDDDEERGEKHGEYHESEQEGGEKGLRLTATNTTFQTECSACHIAYPPQLLPASSWRALMGSLDKHFDTDASLDDKTIAEILPFLEANAVPERTIKTDTPVLRITDTKWFKNEHDEISNLTWKKVKSPSNCMVCHTQADKGIFEEDAVQLPK